MMTPLAQRVAHRYRTSGELGDPQDLLKAYRSFVEQLNIPQAEIDNARRVINETTEKMMRPRDPNAPRVQNMKDAYPGFSEAEALSYVALFKITKKGRDFLELGRKLFLAILQNLNLQPAVRKKVEQANRYYAKALPKAKQYGNARYLEHFDIYEKFRDTAQAHLALATKALQEGKAHEEEGETATRLNVGAFTLVNTGGFDKAVMDSVASLTKKAQDLLRAKRLDQVCYGDIQITNTVGRSARVLAFYHIPSDELFVRANVKPGIDSLQTILHELGHRYQHKFLNGKEAEIRGFYSLINGKERSLGRSLKDLKPTPGDVLRVKSKTYRVKDTIPDRKGYKVLLETETGSTASVTLENYLELQGRSPRNLTNNPSFEGFVSNYAAKNPDENFAETFSYYCLDRLAPSMKEAFEAIALNRP